MRGLFTLRNRNYPADVGLTGTRERTPQKGDDCKLIELTENTKKSETRRWTPEQEATLEMLANPFNDMDKKDIAEVIGVCPQTISTWQRLPGWHEELGKRADAYTGGMFAEAMHTAMLLLRHGNERSKVAVVKIIADLRKLPETAAFAQNELNLLIVGADGQNSLHKIRAACGAGAVPSVTSPLQDTELRSAMGEDDGGGNGSHAECDWDELRRAWLDS